MERIYLGATDGHLYALRSDGSAKWTFAGAPGESLADTPAIRADGTVIVSAASPGAGQVYAVSEMGALVWKAKLPFVPTGAPPSPTVDADGTIYVSESYQLVALHSDGSPAWHADAGIEYAMVPALGPDGTVYIGGQNGLQAFTAGGRSSWAFGAWAGPMAVADDGTIFTTLLTGNNGTATSLIAVRPGGTEAWTFAFSGISQVPATDGTRVLLETGPDLVAVGLDGGTDWSARVAKATSGAAPVIDGAGTVYVGTFAEIEVSPCGLPCEHASGAGLQAFRADGTSAWVFQPAATFASPAIGSDGTLYAASNGPLPAKPGLYAIGK